MSAKVGAPFLIASLALLGSCQRSHSLSAQPAEGSAGAPTAAKAPAPPRGKQITLLYSSNMFGEYEPCG